MPKTLTIPASDLRVGDHIINHGVVTDVFVHSPHDVKIRYDSTRQDRMNFGAHYTASSPLLTIERHEPEVTERWGPARPEWGYSSLAEVRALPWDGAIEHRVFHDGKLHAVEIVRDGE